MNRKTCHSAIKRAEEVVKAADLLKNICQLVKYLLEFLFMSLRSRSVQFSYLKYINDSVICPHRFRDVHNWCL